MFLKAESYPVIYKGENIAYVQLKINPLTMKLKAEIELKNGDTFLMKSTGQTNEEFKIKVDLECIRRMLPTDI